MIGYQARNNFDYAIFIRVKMVSSDNRTSGYNIMSLKPNGRWYDPNGGTNTYPEIKNTSGFGGISIAAQRQKDPTGERAEILPESFSKRTW